MQNAIARTKIEKLRLAAQTEDLLEYKLLDTMGTP
jgi:hypothetical protein